MARRGRWVELGPIRCQVLASQIATEPASPHRAFSSARSPPFPARLAAGNDPGRPVGRGKGVDHPGHLEPQGKIGQGLGHLSQGVVQVPGSSRRARTDTGGGDVTQHAVSSQQSMGQAQHQGMLDQPIGQVGLGRQIAHVLRAVVIEEIGDVHEGLVDFPRSHRPGRIAVLGPRVADTLHHSGQLLPADRVGFRQVGFDFLVSGMNRPIARKERRPAFLLGQPVNVAAPLGQPAGVQQPLQNDVAFPAQLLSDSGQIEPALRIPGHRRLIGFRFGAG